MPCLCPGAMTPDEFLNMMIKNNEFIEINELLKYISNKIKREYGNLNYETQVELDEDKYKDAYIKAFSHHLKGCDGK